VLYFARWDYNCVSGYLLLIKFRTY
jgi:hypothetical protein